MTMIPLARGSGLIIVLMFVALASTTAIAGTQAAQSDETLSDGVQSIEDAKANGTADLKQDARDGPLGTATVSATAPILKAGFDASEAGYRYGYQNPTLGSIFGWGGQLGMLAVIGWYVTAMYRRL